MYKKIKVLLLICTINQYLFSQDLINSNFTKKLLSEKKTLFLTSKVEKKSFNIAFSTNFFLNTSHSNLENLNGKFAPKGLSNYSSLLFIYQNDNLFFSIEPQIAMHEEYSVKLPEKVEPFKLSSGNLKGSTPNRLINTGFYINKWGIKLGYGNWNRWSGPAIHNSLMMSNNSDGIPNYFISSSQPIKLLKNLYFNYKYSIYDNLINEDKINYYISFSELILNYKQIELGISKMILSGGNSDIEWKFNDAIHLIYSRKNIKYWDVINDIYLSSSLLNSKMRVFIEIGSLNQSAIQKINSTYQNHTIASIIGIRKYGIGKNEDLMWGIEHTKTIQGPYYDIIPTPNWYSNKKYNYSQFNNRPWAAHSGPDSDDFLIYFGIMNSQLSLIYGINYERHGVTYHFPPEVKFEHRFSVGINKDNLSIRVYYESELYEHYGFVDSNQNVWNETFEPGSVQRTQTLTLSIEKYLY